MNPKLTKKIEEAVILFYKENEETKGLEINVYIFEFPLPEDTDLYSGQEYSIVFGGTFDGILRKKDGQNIVNHRFDIRNMKIRYDNQIRDFQIIDFGQLLPPFNLH